MTDPDSPDRAALVTAYVDLVEARWLDGGLPPGVRRRLAADLEADLLATLDSGAPATDVFADDPATLAGAIAAAEGLTLVPPVVAPHVSPTLGGLVVRAMAAALGTAVVVTFFVLPRLYSAIDSPVVARSAVLQVVVVILIYGVGGAIVLAAACAAMAHYLQRDPRRARRVGAATALMGVFGVVSIAPCVGIGVLTNYSTDGSVVLLDAALVAALCSLGIALGWTTTRSGAPRGSVVERV